MSRQNNFDLIRLVAAIQVVIVHSYEHLELTSPYLDIVIKIVSYFPGVPIFFTISGFLIFASYKKNNNLGRYFKNRFLRIYPNLWFCLILTLGVLGYFGYINWQNITDRSFFLWVFGQVTVFQFFTPDLLREFGVGNPNGSLWTIPIEISFYFFIPLLFWIRRKTNVPVLLLLIVLLFSSLLVNSFYRLLVIEQHFLNKESVYLKLFKNSLLPYLFYFLLGSIIYEKWDQFKKIYLNKGLVWLLFYMIYSLIFSGFFNFYQQSYWPNFFNFLSIILLSNTIISLAFTKTSLSSRLLNNHDLSYGIYLFHMLIINIFVEFGFIGYSWLLPTIILSSVFLAYFSWIFIEKPALKLK